MSHQLPCTLSPVTKMYQLPCHQFALHRYTLQATVLSYVTRHRLIPTIGRSMNYVPFTIFSITNYVAIFISKDLFEISDKRQMILNSANDNWKMTHFSRGELV